MAKARNWAYLAGLVALAYVLSTSTELRHSLGTSIAAVAKPVLIPIVDMILDPAFIYVTSSMIVMAAFASCALFFFKVVRPALVRMQILRTEIARLLQFRKMKAPPHEAPLGLHTLGEFLQKLNLYTYAWASFQKELLDKKRIPAYSFSYFVAADPTSEAIEDDDLMAALPGYFVSIGLILTFAGLVVALYFAAKGFSAGNIEQSQLAILQLLNASAFKFLTSIAALASALMLTVFHGFCDNLVRSERARCVVAIDQCIAVFRAAEVGPAGLLDLGRDETGATLEMLIQAISKLNAEVSRLSSTVAAAGMVNAAEK